MLAAAFDQAVREDWEAQQQPGRPSGTIGDNWLVRAGEQAMSAVWSNLKKGERSRLVAEAAGV